MKNQFVLTWIVRVRTDLRCDSQSGNFSQMGQTGFDISQLRERGVSEILNQWADEVRAFAFYPDARYLAFEDGDTRNAG